MIRLALAGDPVSRSRSPAIHEAALAALGIAGSYEAVRTDAVGLAGLVDSMRTGSLDGLNVTMPLKRAAREMADRSSENVELAGAANTLSFDNGVVVAENTDIGGISDAWNRRQLPGPETPVLVLGAGGAAAAAVLALSDRSLSISSRNPAAATALVLQIGVPAEILEWETPLEGAVVVNATPIGMRGEELPASLLAAASGLLDMAYGHQRTPSVTMMGDRPVADGIDMLVAQAARSFQIWTGRPAPLAAMESAARS